MLLENFSSLTLLPWSNQELYWMRRRRGRARGDLTKRVRLVSILQIERFDVNAFQDNRIFRNEIEVFPHEEIVVLQFINDLDAELVIQVGQGDGERFGGGIGGKVCGNDM